jgi:hypothetical protein
VHLGGKTGNWAYANLGVFAALVLSFLATVLLTSRQVREQEDVDATPVPVS